MMKMRFTNVDAVNGMIMPVSMPKTGSMLPAGTGAVVHAAVVMRLLPGQNTRAVIRTAVEVPAGSNRHGGANNLREGTVDARSGVWAPSI